MDLALLWLLTGLSLAVGCACTLDLRMGLLGTVFRLRLRDLLARQRVSQGALAKHLDVDPGRLSKILKYDAEAATVKLDRLEQIAAFFGVPVADLLRAPEDAPLQLTKDESELVNLYRRLPDSQRSSLLGLLAYTFAPRISAEREREALGILRKNVQRQIEDVHRPHRRGR